MKKETITKVDLNFTNSGGGHTATVSTVLSARNLDGTEGLGTVIGPLGDVNNFSNDRIQTALENFVCTELTRNSGPTRRSISRKYVDKTSLTLKSFIVLVRGVNAPIFGKEYEGPVPYFSETTGSPLKPFPASGPTIHGSTILAGKVYNYEAGAQFDGMKVGLCYHQHELVPELSLNIDAVSNEYLRSPDLAQYELKFGYTLSEFKTILNLAGIEAKGLPVSDDVLFEVSGTLESVVGAIASYFGYFWYVNPDTGGLEFVNTESASSIPVDDFTETSDSNVISASFTESLVTTKIINSYVGSGEKQENESTGPPEDRPRPIFFKRVDLEQAWDEIKFPMKARDLKFWFALFNQGVADDADVFDKYTFALMHLNRLNNKNEIPPLWQLNDNEEVTIKSSLYPHKPNCGTLFAWGKSVKDPKDEMKAWQAKHDANPEEFDFVWGGSHGWKFDKENPSKITHNGLEDGKPMMRAGTAGFYYKLLTYLGKRGGDVFVEAAKQDIVKPLPKPSGTKLREMMAAYFAVAGGIFISNGYSKYKVERMQFTNTNNITIFGPLSEDKNIADVDELAELNDLLDHLGVPKEKRKVGEMQQFTNNEAEKSDAIGESFFFLAIRNIPKLEKKNVEEKKAKAEKTDKAIDFDPVFNKLEFFQHPRRNSLWYLGGPTLQNGKNIFLSVLEIARQSAINYEVAMAENVNKRLKLEYTRSKTRVNKVDEEEEEKDRADKEDRDIAKGDANSQKMSDLADRFDLKSYTLEAPTAPNILNHLSLATHNGSMAEIQVLKDLRGEYREQSDRPSSSSRTLYGLHIPSFKATMNSVSVSIGPQGITTTISESSIKLIPPDPELLMNQGMEAMNSKSNVPSTYNATQRNRLKL